MRKVLKADEDFIYTDGEIYGTIIYLEEGKDIEKFYQISLEEYENIFKEEEIEE